jgi:Do/DeqQ family serine protease
MVDIHLKIGVEPLFLKLKIFHVDILTLVSGEGVPLSFSMIAASSGINGANAVRAPRDASRGDSRNCPLAFGMLLPSIALWLAPWAAVVLSVARCISITLLQSVVVFSGLKMFQSSLIRCVALSVCVVFALSSNPSTAFAQQAPEQLWSEKSSGRDQRSAPLRFDTFANLAEELSPAVVNIEVEVQRSNVWGVQGRGQGQGTGFFIHEDGFIVTNAHVIDNAQQIRVTTAEDVTYQAEIVGVDVATDLALLKVDADRTFPIAPLGSSSDMRRGDWVIAIGNPFGLSQTVTAGIISALGRRQLARGGGYANFIQTDAPINLGNSGGPLINVNGEVVGVNTAILSGNDIGFAIPSDMVKALLPQLADGEVQRAWLGVQLQSVDADAMRRYGLESPRGAVIAAVVPGSPADEGGLQEGDLLTGFAEEPVEDVQHLRWLAASAEIGAEVRVTVIRNQSPVELNIVMGSRNDMASTGQGDGSQSGANGQSSQPPMNDSPSEVTIGELGIRVTMNDGSPTITAVDRSSLAYRMGVREGDVVMRLNRESISTISDMQNIARSLSRGSIVEFVLRRSNSVVQVTYRLR